MLDHSARTPALLAIQPCCLHAAAGNLRNSTPATTQSLCLYYRATTLGRRETKPCQTQKFIAKKYFQISKPGIISNRHANLKFSICGTGERCGMDFGPFYFMLRTYDTMEKKIIEKYPFQSEKETFSECWKYFHTISNFSQACFQHKTWTVSLFLSNTNQTRFYHCQINSTFLL